MNTIHKYLKDQESQMLECLKTLVEHETPSAQKVNNDAFAQKIGAIFTKLTGGCVKLIENDIYGNHVYGQVGKADEQILIIGHYDTVWPLGTLARKPFSIDQDRKAHGPGVFDMKVGLVQCMFAVKALNELGIKLNKQIVFLFNSDEEVGSPTSQAIIEEEAKKSSCAFILEPSAGDRTGALKTARKGVGAFKINITGRAAHAGNDHAKGRSAISEMAKQIDAIHAMTDYERGVTLNVGKICGGSAANVVAAECQAEIDLRFWSKDDAEKAEAKLLALTNITPDTTVKVTGGINRPAMERSATSELYELAREIAKSELGIELSEIAVGGGSDGSFTAPYTKTLDGLGAVGDGAHAEHEFIYVDEVVPRTALLALLIERMAK